MRLIQSFQNKRPFVDERCSFVTQGGNLNRAIDLCFKGELFDSLRTIADNLKEDADPALLSR